MSNFQVFKGIGSGCDKEAIRLIKEGPKWIPARQRGVTARTRKMIPINFKITGN
ncbi:TonB [Microscilla marina ATCC 23134]|uniref:TonB n=1 Tax=Microscilla marina ATCC 23134 TaxID=313606 RepID=A1ZYQ9_MICM2|nr:TonB [Microscilla marina ATCC 23134]